MHILSLDTKIHIFVIIVPGVIWKNKNNQIHIYTYIYIIHVLKCRGFQNFQTQAFGENDSYAILSFNRRWARGMSPPPELFRYDAR